MRYETIFITREEYREMRDAGVSFVALITAAMFGFLGPIKDKPV